ncbi:DHH family phosphoesterase [Allobaculum stercoricanis]|uniref:DHH family phosphoesterase n=1 Tax=Allobaculum stercoricanis TaxID=174709 RepID=UPI00035C3DE2|nr:DHH family phosphoesterase [Allobaculum stercoricanis]
MNQFKHWIISFLLLQVVAFAMIVYLAYAQAWVVFAIFLTMTLLTDVIFFGFLISIRRKGIQRDLDISRVLGKDAKDALEFGEIGIITYDDEYICTWTSDYLQKQGIDLVNQKLTTFLPNIRELFGDVDTITGTYKDQIFEVTHKEGSQVLFVRDITKVSKLESKIKHGSTVVGLLCLDNYDEYQSMDDEEVINEINNEIRMPIIAWAKEFGIFIRRMRSDRYLLVLDDEILTKIRKNDFQILQQIKDISAKLDIAITLSIVLVENMPDFLELDRTLNDALEIIQSRGGDQAVIKNGILPYEFIGGNTEKSSSGSKVRVRIVGSSIQDSVRNGGKVFVLGHVNTDYDAMGAAIAVSSWAKALKKEVSIVLKNVPRDAQLQQTMDYYNEKMTTRHHFITEDEAIERLDPKKDILIMVDHSNPQISSGKRLVEMGVQTIIIDHHRRAPAFPDNVLTSYIESQASSTCELLTELLQTSPVVVPIYEMEATIMYLGILVDTGRFKQHTSERTFLAAGILRSWGANPQVAEQALKESYSDFKKRSALIETAQIYRDKYMIDVLPVSVSRTMLSQISDSLLKFKGCQAAFTIGVNENNGATAISARSDGTVNVQKIMEKMNGGGHFSAAALERDDISCNQAERILKDLLDQEG